MRWRGQSTVEFGIVIIIFFMLISGIVDFGRALNGWVVVSSAAREGARWASIGASDDAVATHARAFAIVPGVDPRKVIVSTAPSPRPPAGGQVAVSVAAEFELMTPLVRVAFGCLGSSACVVPISSTTAMRYEGTFIP